MISNDLIYHQVGIIKLDSKDNQPLANSKINLYVDSNKNLIFDASDKLLGMYTSDIAGKFEMMNLPSGAYFYQEVSAPNGYLLDSKVYTIEVRDDLEVTIFNSKDPNTGDDIDVLLYVLALILSSGLIYFILKKRII